MRTSAVIIVGSLLASAASIGMPSPAVGKDARLNDDLIMAARDSNLDLVRTFLKRGADVNACGSWEGCDTALLRAVATSAAINLAVVKELVGHGADVNKPDNLPLYFAAYFGHTEAVIYLISRNANLPRNSRAITALKSRLASQHFEEIYQVLFSYDYPNDH